MIVEETDKTKKKKKTKKEVVNCWLLREGKYFPEHTPPFSLNFREINFWWVCRKNSWDLLIFSPPPPPPPNQKPLSPIFSHIFHSLFSIIPKIITTKYTLNLLKEYSKIRRNKWQRAGTL